MGKLLVGLGVILMVAGLAWPWLSRLPLFRLPGDLAFGGEGFRVYIPVTTMLLISAVFTVILWIFNRS